VSEGLRWDEGETPVLRWTGAPAGVSVGFSGRRGGVSDGPFSSLCFGERMAFDNPHSLTLLGAVAAWTSRVRISTTVLVPQLHDPISLAKALATATFPLDRAREAFQATADRTTVAAVVVFS